MNPLEQVSTGAGYASAVSLTATKPDAASSFAKMLERMRTGKIDTDEITGKPGAVVTSITQTMSDGSINVLILVDGKVVAEHKYAGAKTADGENAKLLDTKTQTLGKIGADGKFGVSNPLNQTTGTEGRSTAMSDLNALAGTSFFGK